MQHDGERWRTHGAFVLAEPVGCVGQREASPVRHRLDQLLATQRGAQSGGGTNLHSRGSEITGVPQRGPCSQRTRLFRGRLGSILSYTLSRPTAVDEWPAARSLHARTARKGTLPHQRNMRGSTAQCFRLKSHAARSKSLLGCFASVACRVIMPTRGDQSV